MHSRGLQPGQQQLLMLQGNGRVKGCLQHILQALAGHHLQRLPHLCRHICLRQCNTAHPDAVSVKLMHPPPREEHCWHGNRKRSRNCRWR